MGGQGKDIESYMGNPNRKNQIRRIQIYCPKCSGENPDDARLCISCGCVLIQAPVTTESVNIRTSKTLKSLWREPGVLRKIEDFLEANSRKMAELYGEVFADPMRWGPDITARLVLAYIDREKGDKLWYRNAVNIGKVTNESEKKLIVCSCHTGFLAHTSRALMVAEKLRELGHEVVFAVDVETKPDERGRPTQRKFIKLIEKAGFETYHAPLLVGEKISLSRMQTTEGTMGHYNTRMIAEETENMLSILREIESKKMKPHFMLNDSAWVASIPADIMNIPPGSLWNFFISNYRRTYLTLPEKYPLRKVLLKVGGDKLVKLFEKSRIALLILKILLMKWVVPYNFIRIKYMLKERKWIGLKRNMFSQLGGDINLFPDYIAFGGMKINHKGLPVGPIVWEPEIHTQDKQLVSEFEKFLVKEKEKPLIYVTMGSSGELKLFKLIIEALKGKDYRIAITTGEQFDITELGELPEDFFAIPLYPGTEICKMASLMINHGGNGSLNQAIKERLPQISIPTTPEQQWNSDLMARKGLGKQIFPSTLTFDSLNAAVKELLEK